MSSIVTEALASSGTLAKDDISTKISKLSSHAFDVKVMPVIYCHLDKVLFGGGLFTDV